MQNLWYTLLKMILSDVSITHSYVPPRGKKSIQHVLLLTVLPFKLLTFIKTGSKYSGLYVCIMFGYLDVWRLECSGPPKATEGAKTGRQASNNAMRAVKFIDINKPPLDTRVQDPPSLNQRERQKIIFTSCMHTFTCTHRNKHRRLCEKMLTGDCVYS